MFSKEELEKTREFFAKDIFATETAGIEIDEKGDGYAICSMKIDGRHPAAHGNVMGGAIFTLADFTFAVAANSENRLVVTTTSSISYIGAAKTDVLYARSERVKEGKRVCFYETRVYDGDDNTVAIVSVTGTPLG